MISVVYELPRSGFGRIVGLVLARGMTVDDRMYTCPMHPQIVREAPGSCPICGMALEPRTVDAVERPDFELVDMTRRFWIGLVLTLPLLAFVMGDMLPGQPLRHLIQSRFSAWLQLVLATPVVLWAGWPFFQRGWASVVNRSLNMFTLIALGTGMAYVYSVVGALAPGLFPASFRTHGGEVGLYFEAAAVITVLVLLGQVLELRARSQTGARSGRCSAWCPRRHAGSATTAPRRTSRSRMCRSATGYVCALARKSPSTAWCSKAAARWTNRS
jgi:hypothetical protein